MDDELRERLDFFADGEHAAELLEALLAEVSDYEEADDGQLVVSFRDADEEWVITPRSQDVPPELPEDLQAILEHTSGTWFGEPGTETGIELHDGSSGTLHSLGEDAGLDRDRDGFDYSESLCSPLDEGLSLFYIYHPDTNELHLFDQDGGLEEPLEAPVAEIFLERVLEAVVD